MVTRETFLVVAEMVAGHLRLKEADRWSAHICKLKFHSFTDAFPEVNDPQLMWAAEQWVQALPAGFTRYPTWRELMAPLYRREGGLANRSWGPAEGLPSFVQFKPAQLALLPTEPRSMLPPPDIQNPDAYRWWAASQPALLRPADEPQGLTDEHWQRYLNRLRKMQEKPCA